MYYLSCPQIKLGVAAAVYKGKKKPVGSSSSYRRITVSPIIGAIIDNYIDPYAEAIFRPSQSPDQLGFTSGVSYLLAVIQSVNAKDGLLIRRGLALVYRWMVKQPSLLLRETFR